MFLDIVERKYDANTSDGLCVGRSGCSVRVCVELGFFPVHVMAVFAAVRGGV